MSHTTGVAVSSLAFYMGNLGLSKVWRTDSTDSCLKRKSTPAIIVIKGLQQVYKHTQTNIEEQVGFDGHAAFSN